MSFAETPDGITELSTLAGGFISRKLLQLVVFSCVSSLGYYILFNSLHVIRVISKRHKKTPADSSLFFFKKSHGTTKISSHTHTYTLIDALCCCKSRGVSAHGASIRWIYVTSHLEEI